MTEDDRAAFGKAMTFLAETMNEPMSPGRIEGYWRALVDLSIHEVRGAVDQALVACTEFFPKPGKLRELIRPPREYYLGAGAEQPYIPPPDRPALEGPVPFGALLAETVASVQAAVADRQEAEKPKPLTPDQLAERRAVLREQARLLRGEPKGSA